MINFPSTVTFRTPLKTRRRTLCSCWTRTRVPVDQLPVGVRVVVHEPGAVVVHVHGPGLVVLPQHHVLQHVAPSDAEGRIRVVVIAIDGHFPVMDAAGESRVTHNHSVVVAVAGHRQVVVGEDDVLVSGCRVKGEPSDCSHKHMGSVTRAVVEHQ